MYAVIKVLIFISSVVSIVPAIKREIEFFVDCYNKGYPLTSVTRILVFVSLNLVIPFLLFINIFMDKPYPLELFIATVFVIILLVHDKRGR